MPRSFNTTKIGDTLEVQIRDYFVAEINADRFFAKKSCCKVFWKKGYFSKDRNAEIIFDVAIEIYFPGSTEYSLLLLIECKKYSSAIPVNDIEEFYTKVQQVAPAKSKAILASTSAFQKATRSFAKSKGIGLLRYFEPDKVKWELQRSPSSASQSSPVDSALIQDGLSEDDFHSFFFDFYLQTPIRETNSLWDFFDDLLSQDLSTKQKESITNPRTQPTAQIPYLSKDDLEALGERVVNSLEYSEGEIDLTQLCHLEFQKNGLVVNIIPDAISQIENGVLGRIIFDPPVIDLYQQKTPNRGRDRFTLAHELAHHYLSHGNFLRREYCEDGDFNYSQGMPIDKRRISRLEFQANYLAACLLMPKHHFLADFKQLTEILGLHDRGFGQLYLDNQVCNLESFEFVTNRLMEKYGVSRTATKIRLESMDLLKDVRTNSFTKISLGWVFKT